MSDREATEPAPEVSSQREEFDRLVRDFYADEPLSYVAEILATWSHHLPIRDLRGFCSLAATELKRELATKKAVKTAFSVASSRSRKLTAFRGELICLPDGSWLIAENVKQLLCQGERGLVFVLDDGSSVPVQLATRDAREKAAKKYARLVNAARRAAQPGDPP